MVRLYFPAILSSSQSSNPETIASYEESAIPRNNEPDGFRERRRGSKRSTKPIYFLFQQRKIPGSSGDNGKERNRATKNPDKGSLLRERHLENTGNRRYFREYHRRSYQKRSQLIGQRIVFPPFRFLRLILDPTVFSSLCSGMIRIRLAKYPSILSTRVTVCNSQYPEYSF